MRATRALAIGAAWVAGQAQDGARRRLRYESRIPSGDALEVPLRTTIVVLSTVLLGGCVGIEPLPPRTVSLIRVYQGQDFFPPVTATYLGPVHGRSCQASPWDSAPSELAATEALKIQAATKRATLVAGTTFEAGGPTLIPNCLASITATGGAYRL